MNVWVEDREPVSHCSDGWEELANAIILQTVKDYRVALKRMKRWPDNHQLAREKRTCESFFRSWWFSVLTDVDPELILRRLQEEAEL